LSVAVTGDKNCIFVRVQGAVKLITICGKFSYGEVWNLANRSTEFGKIWWTSVVPTHNVVAVVVLLVGGGATSCKKPKALPF